MNGRTSTKSEQTSTASGQTSTKSCQTSTANVVASSCEMSIVKNELYVFYKLCTFMKKESQIEDLRNSGRKLKLKI